MFEHVVIGQYLPGRSYLHKMDARSKLASVFLLIIIVFMTNTWAGYGLLWAGAVLVYLLSGVSFRYIRKGMFPIFLLIIFTFILHALFTQEGDVLVSVGVFTLYEGGVEQGLFIAFRLLLLVFFTSLLTLTTSPIDLTDALEQIFTPLKRFGVPAHEIALMMSIAIRFIPTLLQETEKIIKAQSARGADFSKGTWKERSQAFVALLVPLFVRAFKRAEDLAFAMEARGYNGGEGRTKLRKLTWTLRDSAACAAVVIFGICLFFFRS
ncbi:energy-coupling factor transport system permease protein [Alteribacillus persepolensis]|uniref:Energy-coupling factor transporter transmembrane protein EcfT n=1 Tax=Alteribacillus persepolensis TaxID=568899 RepID=A0A1G8HM11_9BACI|nr:energy-coupling factor transporter transmembrane component T [Alteribacillus persepolensis]SDI07674.1 energy-coupling factor transport system permease protein [Alteribacillus persepolensis]